MRTLNNEDLSIIKPKLSSLGYHTVLRTILDGTTLGKGYIDNQESPKIIFVQFRHRAFIMGDQKYIENDKFVQFFNDVVFNNCINADVSLVRITSDQPDWINLIGTILKRYHPIVFDYQIYLKQLDNVGKEFILPENFTLRQVNQELLSEKFAGYEALIEEMCSERESVEAFLNNSFGIVAFHDNTLAGWCLSEYNQIDRCEVGIATMLPFRRMGLAKAMTNRFLMDARNRGLQTILWHCYKSNTASSRTALSTGFKLVDEHKVMNIYIDPFIGLAVHGNVALGKKDYGKALSFYQQAQKTPNPQAWVAWNSACAAAHQNLKEQVFSDLNLAIDLGFDDLSHLVESDHFLSYHDDPQWITIAKRIS